MTAFADGSAIRVVSTFRTGRKSVLRLATKPGEVDLAVREINAMNHVLNPKQV
jgi:hypothetical protein